MIIFNDMCIDTAKVVIIKTFISSRTELMGYGKAGKAVANVLRGAGVPAGRIATYGRGEDAPVASNQTESGRAQNRRVEIIIRPTR